MTNVFNYYYKVFKNFKSNKLFYKYNSKELKYNHYYKFIISLLDYLLKFKSKPIVITYSNKTPEMYASIVPILVSGSIWVPISTDIKIAQLKKIINLAKPDIFLYDLKNRKILNYVKKIKLTLVNLNSFHVKKKIKKKNIANVIKNINIKNTAFIYFTSGSTGEPKGVKVSHKNIVSDILAQKKHLFKKKKKFIFGDYYQTSFSIFFDIYFPAIFFSSAISPALTKSDKFLIYYHYKKNNINTLHLVPSSLERIKDLLIKNNIKLVGDYLFFMGEKLYLKLLKFVFLNTKFKKIYNCYGGTEMGNLVFFHECKPKDLFDFKIFFTVPIGIPFHGVDFSIKKNELIVEGPMITNGYL
jgi:acyl-coenzyme A synthetase/AMP-(fatty) acid ligase